MPGVTTIEVNKATKEVKCAVIGNITMDVAMEFLTKYKKAISVIDPTEYELRFNCSEMESQEGEVSTALEEAFKEYHKDGFKHIYLEVFAGPSVIKKQLTLNMKRSKVPNISIAEI